MIGRFGQIGEGWDYYTLIYHKGMEQVIWIVLACSAEGGLPLGGLWLIFWQSLAEVGPISIRQSLILHRHTPSCPLHIYISQYLLLIICEIAFVYSTVTPSIRPPATLSVVLVLALVSITVFEVMPAPAVL